MHGSNMHMHAESMLMHASMSQVCMHMTRHTRMQGVCSMYAHLT